MEIGTPVIVTIRGKTVPGLIHGELNTIKGKFHIVKEDLTGMLRKARPAQTRAILPTETPTTD